MLGLRDPTECCLQRLAADEQTMAAQGCWMRAGAM